MAKPIEQMNIDNKPEYMYMMTYQVIVNGKPKTMYEAKLSTDAEIARAQILEKLKQTHSAVKVLKVERWVGD